MNPNPKSEKLKAIVSGLHQVAAGLADLLDELEQSDTPRLATSASNPAGSVSVFRRLVREGRVRAHRRGRVLACDWAEMEAALRADGYQPRPRPANDDDAQWAALDALEAGE